MRFLFLLIAVFLSPLIQAEISFTAPYNFAYVTDIDPTLIENPRYRGMDNFTGRPVVGCEALRMISTIDAAEALKKAHDEFKKEGYMLVVYEAYRPQRVTNAFIRWSMDANDQEAKTKYYPKVDKRDLFKLGYVADHSPYSRGSSFSVTLIRADTPLKVVDVKENRLTNGERIPYLDDNTIDMGSSYDLLHWASNHDSSLIGREQLIMRNYLRRVMKKHGFVANSKEWWSYTLKKEPYPAHYFDFVDLDRRPLSVNFEAIKKEANRPLRPLHLSPVFRKLEGH